MRATPSLSLAPPSCACRTPWGVLPTLGLYCKSVVPAANVNTVDKRSGQCESGTAPQAHCF